jgi:hypothetical protein
MEIITLPLPDPPLNGNGHHHVPALPATENGNAHHKQTGPKTQAGKLQSRMNAVKHGYEATDDIFVATLDRTERVAFKKIRSALRKFYNPKSAYEKLIVDRMSAHHLRMLRLYKVEADAMSLLPSKGADRNVFPHLDRFSRYDVRIEKQLKTLHNRLLTLQNPFNADRPNRLTAND